MKILSSQILADLMAVLHFLWVLWAIVSLPLVILYDWYKDVALIFVCINLITWIILRDCPLLKWENRLKDVEYDIFKRRAFTARIFYGLFKINLPRKMFIFINIFFMITLLLVTLSKFILSSG